MRPTADRTKCSRGPRRDGVLVHLAAALLAALLQAGSLAGCAGGVPPLTGRTDAEGIETVRALFENGEYYDLVLIAKEFLAVHAGSRYRDEAMFLLARGHYEEGDFIDAEDQFRRLLRDFPTSPFAETSAYYLALSLLSQSRGPELDQAETEAALAQFRSFLTLYPESEHATRARGHIADIRARFAAKDFKNGITYMRVRAYRAAIFYFSEKVIEPYPETEWARQASLRLVECAMKLEEWSRAEEYALAVIEKYPGTEEAEEANGRLGGIRKRLAEAGEASGKTAAREPR